MSEEWQKFIKDSRTLCKYGAKCYQTNPEHLKTYKHPPQKFTKHRNNKNKRFSPYNTPKRLSSGNANVEEQSHLEKNVEDENAVKSEKNVKDATSDEINAASSTTSVKSQLDSKIKESYVKDLESLEYYEKDADPKVLKDLFLVEMPPDFFKFYECIKTDDESLKLMKSVNLELIGPYDLLLGKLPVLDNKELYFVHWRFFYDPPEFQAVLKKCGKSEYHIGYYRDTPDEKPVFLAVNDSSKDCHMTPIADNIFGAVYSYLQEEKSKSPFTSMACQKLMDKVKKWAEEYNYSLLKYNMKTRISMTVTKTFHGAGIVVPYNKKTQLGYRPLVESDANIKKLFNKLEKASTQEEKDKIMSELQPVITYGSIAMDECDFGTGLELGINLLCSGLKELEPQCLSALSTAYSLLNREAFSKIIQAHIKYRRRGPNMSLMSLLKQE